MLLGFPQKQAPVIYTDIKALEDLATSDKNHPQCKHVHRLFWMRKQVELNLVRFVHVAGVKNIADFLTKPLVEKTFKDCRERALILPKEDAVTRVAEGVYGPVGTLRRALEVPVIGLPSTEEVEEP